MNIVCITAELRVAHPHCSVSVIKTVAFGKQVIHRQANVDAPHRDRYFAISVRSVTIEISFHLIRAIEVPQHTRGA